MRIAFAALLLAAAPLPAGLDGHDLVISSAGPQYWAISPADAEAAKAALNAYLVTPHPEANASPAGRWGESNRPIVAAHIPDYTLQYRGVRMKGGKLDRRGTREVEIQGLCYVDEYIRPNVMKQWMVVFDGGSCFFNARYDPATRQIVWFTVNGIA